MCTYEGENTVLLLQTARYLMKVRNNHRNGQKLTSTLRYLESVQSSAHVPFERSMRWIIWALQRVAAG